MHRRRFLALFSMVALLASLAGSVQASPGPRREPLEAQTTALVYVPLPTHEALTRFAATGLPAYTRLPGKGLLLGANPAVRQVLAETGIAYHVLDPDIDPLLSGQTAERIYLAYPPAGLPPVDWVDHAPAEESAPYQTDWQRYGRVLLDTGSVVVLRMDPEGAAGLAQAGVAVQPLALVPQPLGNGMAGTLPAIFNPDPLVQTMMDQIISPTLYQYVGDLSGEWPVLIGGEPFTITTRHTQSGLPIRQATAYVSEHLEDLGLDVELHVWSTISNPNVIGEIPGLVHPERIWIVSAHVDDMPPGPLAPGADDNASGAAAVLAAADVLSQYNWGCTLRFVLFTGEEQGLLGSKAYARQARLQREDIRGVVNMDMVAWNTLGSSQDMDLYTWSSLTPTMAMAQVYSDVIAAYTLDLLPEIRPDSITGSDHASFWMYNYPAFLAIEDFGDFNPYYHTTDDLLEHLDMDYFTEIARASLGTLVHLSDCIITDGVGMADGHITTAVGGAPIAEATVTFEDSFRNRMPVTTDAAGYYTRTLPVGAYTATAWAYGYLPATTQVTIYSDTTTTQNFQLALSDYYVVSGTVRDASTTAPLYARISLPTMPVSPVWSDPTTGFYSLTLPVGTYALHITATAHWPQEQTITVTGNTSQDLALEPYACILLVDDDQNLPNVVSAYTSALDALGVDYDLWDTIYGSPAGEQLAGHRLVIWFTGKSGLSVFTSANEQVTAAYLDDGGRFLLSSQDYLHGSPSSFRLDYLGIISYTHESRERDPVGNAGHPIGDGLGPYYLEPPAGWGTGYIRTDRVYGSQGAPFRYESSGEDNSTSYEGNGFRTVFLGWPLELLPDVADRAAVLGRVVAWFGGCGPDGWLAGTATDALSGAPLEAVTMTARPGDWATTTDPGGSYQLTLGTGPYTVTAELAGYYSQTAVVTITAGLTTTHDFALAPIPSCEPVETAEFVWTPLTPTVQEVVIFSTWVGGWMTDTVDYDHNMRLQSDLVLDAASHPHVSYPIAHLVRYAHYDGSGWQTETVHLGEGGTSLALDSTGLPAVSYLQHASVGYGADGLEYAHYDGTIWQIETVDSERIWNYAETALALDTRDQPHISYNTDYDLRYAHYSGTAWITETVGSRGRYSSLALDSASLPHITYCRSPVDCKELVYARSNGTTWITETIDDGGYGTSLALDASNFPHISHGGYELKYAYYNGTKWITETVDSQLTYHTSLALDHAGQPHIVYNARDSLKYAYYDGATWQIETILSSTSEIWGNSIALDQACLPHISYLDGDFLCYARWLPVPTLPITYTWSFGDGFTSTVSATLTNAIPHTYTLPGTYTVTLTATNGCGETVAQHDIVVVPLQWQVYLPLVRR